MVLTLLAVHSQGKETTAASKGIDDLIFRPGDVLLVQGSQKAIQEVKTSGLVVGVGMVAKNCLTPRRRLWLWR